MTGPFAGYEPNREPFLGVMQKHRDAVEQIDRALDTFGRLGKELGVI